MGRAVTAGHAGNRQRCAQAVAQKLGRQIDRALVEFRERFVHQVHVIPAWAGEGVNVAGSRQAQVVGFAGFDELVHS